ncbi:MAG: nucleoside 2-deoxyribosyltransferase [Planctomycetes bacterium]|nr:nucleoside 2-deoxyribosyltransferase [Planctomycetota bacterium]MBM4086304.1 nucleoside 2-deoxyribosyltransferase [Planctomycetota bacterium]
MVVYLSAPLFTQVERRWNRELAGLLEKGIPGARVVLPQDFKVRQRYNDRRSFPELFRSCLRAIDEADVVVAVLDGADCDSGTAFEVGYAYAKGKPVIGVRTDFRKNQDRGLNIMLANACSRYVPDMSFSEDLELLVRDVILKIKHLSAAGAGKEGMTR